MQAVTAIALSLTYLAAGFAVCAGLPDTTMRLAYATVDDASSPFDKEQLISLAGATREYTVGAHDRDTLVEALVSANAEAGTPYANATAEELISKAPDAYTLDAAAISHLDDVNDLVERLTMPIVGVAIIAAFCLMGTLRMFGYEPVGRALIWAGACLLAVLLIVWLWGLVGFSGFFAGVHALLFSEGTWLFPADSLLITMFPQGFWMGMGLVWLVVSGLLATISTIGGALMLRHAKRRKAAQAAASAG